MHRCDEGYGNVVPMARFFSIEEMKARDIMSTDVVTAECGEVLSEILGHMKKNDVYELPVLEKGRLVGMVSYGALLKRRQLPLSSEARTVMVSAPEVAEDDNVPHIAEALLSSDLRAVPVTRRSKLVGIVSRGDIVRNLSGVKEISALRVSDIMTPSPVTIGEKDNIEKARQAMKSIDERSVPVVNSDGRLVGVVGARDIVQLLEDQREKRNSRLAGDRTSLDITVESIMSSPAIFLGPGATVAEALVIMSQNRVSNVVVAENERPVGVLGQADVLMYLTSLKEREGMYLNITGLEDQDPDTYDGIYAIVEKAMKRILNIARPQTMTIHIARHNTGGDVSKHSIRVRLQTRKGLFLASTFDWDVFSATDDAMRKLEHQIRREADREKSKPHKKGIVD
jgi:CBS domain-containing protein/ribosome-associated translation inhibitor RaiA